MPIDKQRKWVYNMYDEYCPETKTSSMARTNGLYSNCRRKYVFEGLFSEKGVFPPELIGKHEACFNYFMKYLEERNIYYVKSSRLI